MAALTLAVRVYTLEYRSRRSSVMQIVLLFSLWLRLLGCLVYLAYVTFSSHCPSMRTWYEEPLTTCCWSGCVDSSIVSILILLGEE